MAKEIERKFLVRDTTVIESYLGQAIVQGYLPGKGMTPRVRIIDDEQAFLTVKSPRVGFSRDEFEYEIPLADARQMLGYCEEVILSKTRYHIVVGAHVWDVDVFHGALEGLVRAEIELDSESESFERPKWLGKEVTEDRQYSNKRLAKSQAMPLRLVA